MEEFGEEVDRGGWVLIDINWFPALHCQGLRPAQMSTFILQSVTVQTWFSTVFTILLAKSTCDFVGLTTQV